MTDPKTPINQIANDEHDAVTKAKRVVLVESSITLNPGDIKLGTIEIKDGDTDDKLTVNPDGSIEVNVRQNDSDIFANYKTNDLEEIGNLTYVGQEKPDGTWLIQLLDETTGLVVRYANLSNNLLTTNYSNAWTNRATLTYENMGDLDF